MLNCLRPKHCLRRDTSGCLDPRLGYEVKESTDACGGGDSAALYVARKAMGLHDGLLIFVVAQHRPITS